MGQSIRTIVDGEEFSAELNDSETADAIVEAALLDMTPDNTTPGDTQIDNVAQ